MKSSKVIQYKDHETGFVDHVIFYNALDVISKPGILIHRREDANETWYRFHKTIQDCPDRWMCRRENDDGTVGKLFKIKIEDFLVEDPVENLSDAEANNLSD